MYIHKTHSKKNLRELFKELGYEFNGALNKREICIKINDLLLTNLKINPENSYNIKELNDLKEHLIKPNYNEKIDTEKKKEVMTRAKRIIHFAKTGYNIHDSYYNNITEVHTDTIFISAYGFLPTIRRACNLYNKCSFKVDHINAQIPLRIQKEIEENKMVKKSHYYTLTVDYGNFIVDFS